MTDNAAAIEAPATEEVVETSDRDAMAAVFDKLQEADETPAEPPVEPVDETPEPAPAIEVPTDLPGALKGMWADLPESAREAVLGSHRDLSAKYSQATRDLQGIGPIRDAVIRAAKEIPGMKDMTPDQIAQDVYRLAQAGQSLRSDPAKALRGLAEQHKVDLQSLITGAESAAQPNEAQKTIDTMRREMAALRQQIQTQASPEHIRQEALRAYQEDSLARQVTSFAADKPHWQSVEPHLPHLIPVVQAKLGENAAPDKVLQEAYEMAVNTFVPDAKAQTEAGDEPAPEAPERVKAAVKAKSVNVQSKPSGNAKPLSARDQMAAVWDKLNAE